MANLIVLKRSCAGCTACCKIYQIESIKKPAGVWCKHCNQGSGCAIYSARPRECQAYECAWLAGFGKVSDRPDRTDIVVDSSDENEFNVKFATLWEMTKGSLEKEFGVRALGFILKQEYLVIQIHSSGQCVLNIPRTLEALPDVRRFRTMFKGKSNKIVVH